jgi:ubiquinol-cytochrome c reductase cytochrome c subunit
MGGEGIRPARRRSIRSLAPVLLVTLAATAAGSASAATAPDGRALYDDGCASCHGLQLQGVPGRGPALRGVGAGAADFYLSTGRMPLRSPTQVPRRAPPQFTDAAERALVAFIGSFGGPPVATPHPERGNVAQGFAAFERDCAGCHQIAARGGILPRTSSPGLLDATQVQIEEAVRTGPYVMPPFGPHMLDQSTLDSIVRYIATTRRPDDRGGFGLWHLGPVPEGFVAWAIALLALVLVALALGKREPAPPPERGA